MVEPNYRILVVDDTPSIQEDFRKILLPKKTNTHGILNEVNALLTDAPKALVQRPPFVVDCCSQSKEAIEHVYEALKRNEPYAVAFVDVVMPPGEDGIATIKAIWDLDSEIQTVLCTAYSTYTSDDIINILGYSDRLFVIKKPFEAIEVFQTACALTKKWNLKLVIEEELEVLKKADVTHEAHQRMKSALESLKKAVMSLPSK
jgi:CheY-like chemotaxis protein